MDCMKRVGPWVAILLVSGWLAGAPKSARAEDWAFTKWGMSVEEVVAASGGKASPCDASACENQSRSTARAELTMPLQMDGFDLIAVFNFDRKTHQLTEVNLRPKNTFDNTRWARETRIKLKDAHGPWVEEQWFGMPTWTWKWGDGEIQMFETTKYDMDVANVSYMSKAALDAIEADE